jgi:hypothetical protein
MRGTKILELGFKGLGVVILLSGYLLPVLGQENTSARLLEFKYGVQAPLSDMKTRFGGNNSLGISFQFADLKRTLLFGIEGTFIFGNTVKEDVLANLRTFDGNLIGLQGGIGDVSLRERGYYIGADVAKIFKTSKAENNLTGIRTQIGMGFLQHKIRVQDNNNVIVALNDDYIKGYDRLTNGPAMHLALGFQYQNPKNNFHFNLMGDLYAARTASRRDYDSLTGAYLEGKRNDLLAGVTVSYVVLISKTDKADHIYY